MIRKNYIMQNRPSITSLCCLTARALCCLLCLLSVSSALKAKEQRPNVLFILTEDQGAHLSFLGTPGLHTPNMDQIAREGIYFNQAFVNYPVCSPSKACIFTGTYCHTNGLRGVTTNFLGPASKLPKGIANHPLTKRLRIRDDLPTLVELFDKAGYSSAITFKLHVHPVSKFPYQHYIEGNPTYQSVKEHFENANKSKSPVFYFANIAEPHRPFRNSDEVDIGINVQEVTPPPFLPDTPTCRKDWAEYLGHCEQADRVVGEILRGLDDSGQKGNTLIVLMGDHGPAYHRGKLALYDLGIRVPLVFCGPTIKSGKTTDQLVSEVDLMPTLLELCGLKDFVPAFQQGRSIAPFLRGEAEGTGNDFIFSEIDHGAMVREDSEGMQERCVYDGRWKVIYRENLAEPRQVNADLKYFQPDPPTTYQGNRVYDEIVTRRKEFPEAYRLLALIDNGTLLPGKSLPIFELYDLDNDPWELNNLAEDLAHKNTLKRLIKQLQTWLVETDDTYTILKSLSTDTDTILHQLNPKIN